MMKQLFIYFLCIIGPSCFATSGSTLYCFEGVNLSEVENYLTPILKSEDKVAKFTEHNCLNITISVTRIPLFDSWLRRRYRYRKKISLASSGHQVRGTCSLEVTRKEKFTTKSSSGQVGARFKLNKGNGSRSRVSKSRLLLDYGKEGSMSVGQENIVVTCTQRGANSHGLKLYLQGSDSSIATDVTIVKGESLDLGEVSDELQDKRKSFNLKKGLMIKKTSEKRRHQYFVKVL